MVGSLTREVQPSDRVKHGTGPSKRLSATEDRLERSVPTTVPAETPVPVKLPNSPIVDPVTGVPMGQPHGETPAWIDNSPSASAMEAMIEALQAAKLAAKKPAKSPMQLGFKVGWKLGQFLIDRGWLPMPGSDGTDSGLDPSHYAHPNVTWTYCENLFPSCPDAGYFYRVITDGYAQCHSPNVFDVCPAQPSWAAEDVKCKATPWEATQVQPGTTVGAYKRMALHPGFGHGVAAFFPFGGTQIDPGTWTTTLTPGVGTPIAPAPDSDTEVDPMWPQQQPKQTPWKEAAPDHPAEQPTKQPVKSPDTVTDPSVVPWVPAPFVVVVPRPETVPGTGTPVVPQPGTSPGTGPDTVPEPAPLPQILDFHPDGTVVGTLGKTPKRKNKKPKKRERQGKNEQVPHVGTVAPNAWYMVNMLTEGLDFVDALYRSLPKECRRKFKPTPYDKAKAIYDCWDHLDLNKAVQNFLNNEIEDFIYGQVGQATKKAQQEIGSGTGLASALGKAQKGAKEAGEAEGGNEGNLPLPQLQQQPNGQWVLTLG